MCVRHGRHSTTPFHGRLSLTATPPLPFNDRSQWLRIPLPSSSCVLAAGPPAFGGTSAARPLRTCWVGPRRRRGGSWPAGALVAPVTWQVASTGDPDRSLVVTGSHRVGGRYCRDISGTGFSGRNSSFWDCSCRGNCTGRPGLHRPHSQRVPVGISIRHGRCRQPARRTRPPWSGPPTRRARTPCCSPWTAMAGRLGPPAAASAPPPPRRRRSAAATWRPWCGSAGSTRTSPPGRRRRRSPCLGRHCGCRGLVRFTVLLSWRERPDIGGNSKMV